ncbi:MAG: hypothetical protein Phog2KO_43940 [Phototrophicaceae bacterium]
MFYEIFCSFFSVLAQDQESCVPQLVFSSNMTGDFEIYLIDIPPVGELATELVQLTNDEGTDQFPRWSPTGEFIAYDNADADLVIIDDAGQVIDQFIEPDTVDLSPTWNDLGTSIAFISSNGVEVVIGIYIPNLSENLNNFSPNLFHFAIDDIRKNLPDWSPTGEEGGSLIALEADWDGNSDIWTYNPATQIRENLTKTDYQESAPAWSPDGSQIAYMSWESGSSEIWILDIETRQTTNITESEMFASSPQWSPDGEMIVFAGVANHDRGIDLDLYIMDADGGNIRQITDFVGYESFPDWRPCNDTPIIDD